MSNNTDLGTVQIRNEVIGTIAALAAQEVSGVSELWKPLPLPFWMGIPPVRVDVRDQEVRLALCLVVDYGADVPTVANQVQDHVREMIDRMTHLTAVEVNVSIHHVKRKKENGRGGER